MTIGELGWCDLPWLGFPCAGQGLLHQPIQVFFPPVVLQKGELAPLKQMPWAREVEGVEGADSALLQRLNSVAR